jgi:hypothetical protein
MIELFRLSDDGSMCVSDKDMMKLVGKGVTYHVEHDHIGYIGQATVVEVKYDKKVYLADKDTGSMYDIVTLRCFSGPLELKEVK